MTFHGQGRALPYPDSHVLTTEDAAWRGAWAWAWRVGVGSGGTFTDVCLFDETSGAVLVWKVGSTPDDPSRGIAQGVAEGLESADVVTP